MQDRNSQQANQRSFAVTPKVMVGIGLPLLVLLIVAFAAGPIAVITMVNRTPVTTASGTTAALHPVETVINVERDRVFNDLRSQYLDDRAEAITWWLMAAAVSLAFITVVVTALGIMIVIGGFVGYGWFRDILTDARRYTEDARDNATEAANRAEKIRAIHEQVQEQSSEIESLLKVEVDPTVSTADAAEYGHEDEHGGEGAAGDGSVNVDVEEARRLQREGSHMAAIEKWRTIARDQERKDDALAALAWASIGHLRSRLTQDVLAIAAFDAAARLTPANAQIHFNRGLAKSRLGNYAGAIEDFETVIRLDSAFPEVYYHRGYARIYNGDYEGAIDDYTTALGYEPEEPIGYYNRGVARSRLGDVERAISDYTAAITTNPQYALAHHSRGIAQSSLNRDEEAINDFNTAISLNPNDPSAHYSLGIVLAKLNRNPEARKAFSDALNLAGQVGVSDLQEQIRSSLGRLME